jgi:hypothetical protein
MYGKRKDADTMIRMSEQRTGSAPERPSETAPVENGIAREQPIHEPELLTLDTSCACGHTRRDHRGLRIEVAGPCLECDCEEFARATETAESNEQTMERIRAALERVERMREIVALLRKRANNSPDIV